MARLKKWHTYRLIVLLLAGSVGMAVSPVPKREHFPVRDFTAPKPKYVHPKAVPTSVDAVNLAGTIAQQIPPYQRCNKRFLLVQEGPEDGRSKRVLNAVLNFTHRAATVIRSDELPGAYLLMVDLYDMAPVHKDYVQFREVWESLQYDPMFSRFLTRDQLSILDPRWPRKSITKTRTVRKLEKRTKKVAAGVKTKDGHREIPPGLTKKVVTVDHKGGDLIGEDGWNWGSYPPGKYPITNVWETREEEVWVDSEEPYTEETPVDKHEVVDVLRYPSTVLDQSKYAWLCKELQTCAPVVDWHYFAGRGMHSTQSAADSGQKDIQDGVWKTIFSGLYFQFTGINDDLNKELSDIGAGFVDAKGKVVVSVDQAYDANRSDQAALMWKSGVTDKMRDFLIFPTRQNEFRITGDGFNETIDVTQQQFRNALNPQRFARESIGWGRGPRGFTFPRYGLWNKDNKRTNVVPPNVIASNPRTKRQLEAGMDCFCCHSIEGVDGVQPVPNDFLDATVVTDVFGEMKRLGDITPTKGKHTVIRVGKETFLLDPDTAHRIASKFKLDYNTRLNRTRMDLMEAMLHATGTWIEGPDGKPAKADALPDQTTVCRLVAEQLEAKVGRYYLAPVGAKEALYTFGLDVREEQAVETFKALCPPDPRNIVTDQYGKVVFIQEDPVVAGLASGKKITRPIFSLSQDYIAERVMRNPLYLKMRKAGTAK